MRLPLVVAAVAALLLGLALLLRPRVADRDELVFWAMGSEAEVADSILDEFRREHPRLPVRVQRLPWSAAHEKLLTAYAGDSMPDVFQLGSTWMAEFALLGALEPLDERLAASKPLRRDSFFPGALDTARLDGRLLALPWYVDTRLLYYRPDLLEAAGLGEPPRSWAEWRELMRKIRDAAPPDSPRFGAYLPIAEWQTPVILALQLGASLLKDGDRYGNFRSDEVRRAFDWYVSLFRDGLVPARSEAELASLYGEFASGYFASFVSGPWSMAELRKRRVPWQTAPMPGPQEQGAGELAVSIAGGADLAIASSSARKDEAWMLVEWLAGAGQRALRQRSGDLPANREAFGDGVAGGAGAETGEVAFYAQMQKMVAPPKLPEWERIAAKITLQLERVVRGDTTLDEALAALDADVDAILEKRRSMLALRPAASEAAR